MKWSRLRVPSLGGPLVLACLAFEYCVTDVATSSSATVRRDSEDITAMDQGCLEEALVRAGCEPSEGRCWDGEGVLDAACGRIVRGWSDDKLRARVRSCLDPSWDLPDELRHWLVQRCRERGS